MSLRESIPSLRNRSNSSLRRSWLALALGVLVVATSGSCAETAGSGELVPIPNIVVDCRTNDCQTKGPGAINLVITVWITPGPCSLAFSYVRSASTTQINCIQNIGCRGSLTNWTDGTITTSTMPSGVYNLCAVVNYDNSLPFPASGDTQGVLGNVAIGSSTANQFITVFEDL